MDILSRFQDWFSSWLGTIVLAHDCPSFWFGEETILKVFEVSLLFKIFFNILLIYLFTILNINSVHRLAFLLRGLCGTPFYLFTNYIFCFAFNILHLFLDFFCFSCFYFQVPSPCSLLYFQLIYSLLDVCNWCSFLIRSCICPQFFSWN